MLAVLALPLLALACGGDDSAPQDTDADEEGGQEENFLPSAFLRYEPGGAFELMPGSHCWDGGCIDMAGPLTQVEPLQLFVGEPLAFSFEAGLPTEFSVAWFPAPRTAPAPEGHVRVWTELADVTAVHNGTTVPTRTGKYIVTVLANWDGEGSVAYGLFADVTPRDTNAVG